MNDNSGWIKIQRSILDHWIWQDAQKFHWWIELLFMANWEQKKVVVGNTIVTVERGQMVASNSFLMERWGVCTHTVRNFLRLLEADGMITQTAYPKFNIITICNYDKYQNKEIAKVDHSADLKVTHNADPLADPNSDPNKEYKNIRTKEDITPHTPQGGLQEDGQTELFPDDVPPQKPKGKKKDNEEDFDFKSALIGIGVSEETALEWMKLRKKHKATNSERSFNVVHRAIEDVTKRLNITPTNVIEICLARGWYGCQTSYFEKIKLSDFGIASASQPSLQLQANRYEMIDEQGNRYYLQGYGKHKVIIPTDAPPRPSETMFWSNFTKSWYQP